MSLTVLTAGLQALLQDGGRPGFASSGVGCAGAFDRAAHHQANALVGNPVDLPVVELLGGGFRVRASRAHVMAVTGAVGPVLVDGHPVEHGRSFVLPAGAELAVETFVVGLRAYVAVGGGFAGEASLGSVSTDTLAGLGPPPLTRGTRLRCGFPTGPPLDATDVPALITSGTTAVDVVVGPRDDWFTRDALARFLSTAWTASSTSNRIGIRLDGPTLDRAVTDELPSEPCVVGSVQVTAAGQPVVFGPDHPVTGGYPVIAVVVDRHLDRLAQLRPGETLRFRRA